MPLSRNDIDLLEAVRQMFSEVANEWQNLGRRDGIDEEDREVTEFMRISLASYDGAIRTRVHVKERDAAHIATLLGQLLYA